MNFELEGKFVGCFWNTWKLFFCNTSVLNLVFVSCF